METKPMETITRNHLLVQLSALCKAQATGSFTSDVTSRLQMQDFEREIRKVCDELARLSTK
jgi:hypothetical protein